jgi:hypothetical protein
MARREPALTTVEIALVERRLERAMGLGGLAVLDFVLAEHLDCRGERRIILVSGSTHRRPLS